MNADKTVFSYKSTKKSTLKSLFLSTQTTLIIGWFFSLVTIFLASFLPRNLVSLTIDYFFLLLLIILPIGALLFGIHNRLTTFVIKGETLSWQHLWKKVKTVRRDEIKTVEFKSFDFNKKGCLHLNKTVKIPLQSLPPRKVIEVRAILPLWLPEESLSLELREYLEEKKRLTKVWQEKESFSLWAQTDKKKAIQKQRIVFASVIIFLGLVLWLTSIGPFREVGTPIFLMGIVLFYVSIVIWATTRFKRIQVDERGITYQQGKNELFWRWGEIEVLAIQTNSERLHIWQGPRYKSYSYSRIEAESMNEVANTIFQQAMIRNIPVARV